MRISVGDGAVGSRNQTVSVELYRDDEVSFWRLDATDEEWELKPDYVKALPLYLNGLDSIFAGAREQDEAQLILSLLGIKGLQAAGWDAYDTTIDAIRAVTRLYNETEDRIALAPLALGLRPHRGGGGALRPARQPHPRRPGRPGPHGAVLLRGRPPSFARAQA